MRQVILKAVDLCKYFHRRQGTLFQKETVLKAVEQVNMEVRQGQVVAVIGESGCGKTTFGCTIARIYPPTAGEIWFDGEEISKSQRSDLKRIRRRIQMVFQDPGSSLNPRHRIESIISLPLRIHSNLSGVEMKRRVMELLDLVNLPHDMMVRYPSALSGGEKQRVGIARALALNPKVVILDEPTSALDVSVQAKVLHLLRELQQNLQLTYILITHNLSLAKHLADEVYVMYLGRVVEMAETETIFQNPLHPYTKALLAAIPVITQKEKEILPEEVTLNGDIPSPENPPKTCPFLSRCKERRAICEKSACPDLVAVERDHFVRCLI
jgi:oligopeptide transport system ATP-binding protein